MRRRDPPGFHKLRGSRNSSLAVCACILALLLAGCAAGAKVTGGADGATIAQAQGEAGHGPEATKARIAVGAIVNKTVPEKNPRRVRHAASPSTPVSIENVTRGVRDMLSTALFNSNRFIVLEREHLNDALVEQDFSASGKVGDASKIPMGEMEGAELLLIGALTGFSPDASGFGGFPLPIPLNKRGDVGVMDIEYRKAHIAMDLRVIDVKTGRILATAAVEGSASNMGLGLSQYGRITHGNTVIRMPIALRGYANTPVEKAINKMVDAAVGAVVEKTPEVYFHH